MNTAANIHAHNPRSEPVRIPNADRHNPDTDISPVSHTAAKIRKSAGNDHPKPLKVGLISRFPVSYNLLFGLPRILK
jgi:hypothetical protein